MDIFFCSVENDLIQLLKNLILIYEYDDDIYNSILTVIINTRLIEMIPDVKNKIEFTLLILFWLTLPETADPKAV